MADSTQVALINDVIKSAAYNKDEVSELLWANTVEIRAHWEEMTPWFRILFDRVLEPWLLDLSACLAEMEDDLAIINLA